jgi:hypothetical protein
MCSRGLAGPLIARLAETDETRFVDQAAWQAHLNRLGIVSPANTGLAVIQDAVQIATEGALWGSIHAHGPVPIDMSFCSAKGQGQIERGAGDVPKGRA